MPDWAAYAEAEKRGILPPEKASLYSEAKRRGLVPSMQAAPMAEPTPPPSPVEPQKQSMTAMGPIDDQKPDIAERPGLFEPYKKIGRELVSGVGEAVSTGQDIKRDIESGAVSPARGGAQALLSTGFRGGVSEPLQAGFRGAMQTAKYLTDIPPALVASKVTGVPFGEVYREAVQQPGPMGRTMQETAGKALAPPMEAAGKFVEEKYVKGDPTRARDVEAARYGIEALAMGASPYAGKLSKVAGAEAKRKGAALNMVLERETPSVATERAARTKVTAGRKKVYQPTKFEGDMADAMDRVQGWRPSDTVQMSLNKAQQKAYKMGDELQASLDKKGVMVPREEHRRVLHQAIGELDKNATLTGDARKVAENMISQYAKIMDENPGTVGGVLKARKQYDRWIESQKRNIFDPEKISAASEANRIIRRASNDLIANKVPDMKIKESLREQHLLLSARDNMAPKAAREAETAFGRAVQRLEGKSTLKDVIFRTAGPGVALGAASLAGIGDLAAQVALGVGGAYIGGKYIGIPATKQLIKTVIKNADKETVATLSDYLASLPEEGGAQ